MAITYSQALEIAISATTGEVAEKLSALKAQMEKKHNSSKPTKNQIENEAVKNEILEALASVSSPVTVSEILGLMENVYTNQKISALLRQLKDAGKVTKEIDKKKVSRFSLA